MAASCHSLKYNYDEMTRKKSESDQEKEDKIVNETAFDAVCSCKECNHDLVRDCLKVSCICCKGSSHSMILNGIDGFPPTTDSY